MAVYNAAMDDIPLYLQGHGTVAGYKRHIRYGIAICKPCSHASRFDAAWRKLIAGRRVLLPRCNDCGSIFPTHRCAAERSDDA